jgi:hypothetical protein
MTPRQDPCQESSSVRHKGQRLYGELHRRFHHTERTNDVNPLLKITSSWSIDSRRSDRMRFGPCINRVLGGHDSPVDATRKKSIPAGCTAIGWKVQPSEQPGHRTRTVLAGNSLQVHISTHPAMHIPDILNGRGPCIKPQVAASTPPGPQQYGAQQIVLDTLSARTPRAVAMTRRTNQFRLPLKLFKGYGTFCP